jgi:large conductance mechanosensitive channel
MSMMEEFKKFAISGNVLDLAVGVVIGGAFGKITNALVADIIMPPISLLTGKLAFKDQFINLGDKPAATLEQAAKEGIPVLAYGNFIQTCLEFFIIAFSIFLVVKQINKLRGKEMAEAGK